MNMGTPSSSWNIGFPDWKEVFYLPLLSAAAGLTGIDQVGKICFLGRTQNSLQFYNIPFSIFFIGISMSENFQMGVGEWELEFHN